MRRIVIGAMARSGSTWAFNAARMLAAMVHGSEAVNASAIGEYLEIADAEVEIIKTHEITGAWAPADKVITCIRDLRDAFCSAVAAQLMEVEAYNRRGLCAGVFTGMDLLLVDPSLAWDKYAGLFIHFEQMTVNKVGMLMAIGDYLFPDHDFDPDKLEDIAIRLEILPEVYDEYDSEQGYICGWQRHRQHVGIGGYRQRLPYADIQYIESKYREWFEYFNYPTGMSAVALGEDLYE